MLKLFKPYITDDARANVQRVLSTDQIGEGQEVKDFERELEQTLGKKNILTLNSGTTALEMAYELSNLGLGDEVIVPVLTCTATNLPLLRRGVKIIFADIDYDLNVDVLDVVSKITPRTKAIVFVHFGGNSRGLKEIKEVCDNNGIILIEDCAQSILSDYWGVGDFACVSLQAIKSITSGDGGFLVCKYQEDWYTGKRLRWFGYDRDEKQAKGDTDLEIAGYKWHMNNITASIGRGNLAHFYEIKKHIKTLAEIYKSYGLFAHTWLAGGFAKDYEGLKKKMADNGYEIGQHHYRNDKYTVFGGRQELMKMDILENKYFFVPFHMGVSVEDAHKIGKLCAS